MCQFRGAMGHWLLPSRDAGAECEKARADCRGAPRTSGAPKGRGLGVEWGNRAGRAAARSHST